MVSHRNHTRSAFCFKRRYLNYLCSIIVHIISREIFETAQVLMKNRLITNNYPVIYPFTRKLECSVCGNYVYRKVCRDKYYWVCNKHDYSASLCSSKKIIEESIINAFIKLFNKIYSNYTELLLPIQKSLQELIIKQTTGRSDIIEIRRSILQLKLYVTRGRNVLRVRDIKRLSDLLSISDSLFLIDLVLYE